VLVLTGVTNAAFFATYEGMKRTLPFQGHPLNHLMSASIAEVVGACFRVPSEVVKTRTQTFAYGPLASNSLATARLVWKIDGWGGFYCGFTATVIREIPFTSFQFPMYEFFKWRLARYLGRISDDDAKGPSSQQRPPLHAYEAAMCASLSGSIAAALTTPLDVVKTRVMLDLNLEDSITHARRPKISLLRRFIGIYKEEGLRKLYSGTLPRTAWVACGGAIFLGTYEWVLRTLNTMSRS